MLFVDLTFLAIILPIKKINIIKYTIIKSDNINSQKLIDIDKELSIIKYRIWKILSWVII